MSAPEILGLMESMGHPVNKTTVYRELDFLETQEIARSIIVADGMRRYELAHGNGHHHHLVCTGCNAVECVEIEQCITEDVSCIERRSGFKVTEHSLKFYGLCQRCRA